MTSPLHQAGGPAPAAEAKRPSRLAPKVDPLDDLTYEKFLKFFPSSDNPANTLKDLPETIIIRLDRDLKLQRNPEQKENFGKTNDFALYLLSEQITGSNLVYLFAPVNTEKEVVIPKGKAVKFEHVLVTDDTAVTLAKKSMLPLIFREIVEAPEPTPIPIPDPTPIPIKEPTPFPSFCPLIIDPYGYPCRVPPGIYASVG